MAHIRLMQPRDLPLSSCERMNRPGNDKTGGKPTWVAACALVGARGIEPLTL
jgi:hypothetical protein